MGSRSCSRANELLAEAHCHASTLPAGEGYRPHIDHYDVAIVVLEGEVETLGERVGPHGVIFYAAGEPHGMRNPGQTVARYVVFEFHGGRTGEQTSRYGEDGVPTTPCPRALSQAPSRRIVGPMATDPLGRYE